MWQITINGPGYFDTQYDLPDGVTSLGRADENDIVLSGDLVSRKHARFVVKGELITVEDLGSRNGSKVNGEPLKGTRALVTGDTVSVGENTVVLRQPSDSERANTDVVDLGVGGIRRFGVGSDISSAVLIAKDVSENAILRALDNVLPFTPGVDSPLVTEDRTPPAVPYTALALLYKTAEKLSSAESLLDFLESTADRLMDRVNAKTAVILLRQAAGALVPAVVRHRGQLAQGEVPVSDAIIQEALRAGSALVVADVRDDERFAGRESVILYGADQVLCIPIGLAAPFTGALYLNRDGRDRSALESLLDLSTAVAHLISTGVEKFRLKERAPAGERLRNALGRAHAPHVVERRASELARAAKGKGAGLEAKDLTALFGEATDLTGLGDSLSPAKLGELLNEFHERMTGLVLSFDGSLEGFGGASIRAVFGAPYPKSDDAPRAVRAALAMQLEWERLIQRHCPEQPCLFRIGLCTGPALAGMVGPESRLDFTAVGQPVDVATWLCQLAQPGQTLISGQTLAVIGARFDVTPLGERSRGEGKESLAVFEVLDEDAGFHTNPGTGDGERSYPDGSNK